MRKLVKHHNDFMNTDPQLNRITVKNSCFDIAYPKGP